MIVLSNTTDLIEVVLNATIATNQLQCMSSRRDITTTGYTPGRTIINTNNTTDVIIVGSPGASTQRVVDQISIYNNDTKNAGVIVKFSDNGTEYILVNVALGPQERLEYSEKKGWRVHTNIGAFKTTILTQSFNNNSTMGCMVLNADQVINDPVANMHYRIIGFNPIIEKNKIYFIRMKLIFSINATSDGILFGVNTPLCGSSANRLIMRECKPTSTTAETPRMITGTNYLGASVNTSASTTANLFDCEGIVGATANSPEGPLEFYVAPESASSTITLKRGSVLYRQEVI